MMLGGSYHEVPLLDDAKTILEFIFRSIFVHCDFNIMLNKNASNNDNNNRKPERRWVDSSSWRRWINFSGSEPKSLVRYDQSWSVSSDPRVGSLKYGFCAFIDCFI